ncbi:MAG: RagB/SusD family nutrient uptake outer membrane protein [Prevotellaceae bacterium]|jgi:hypothetical protein|nr:RagB/SusD family nutrient uptake outer membrane protein [Prevotellaceae bacterium]
MKNKIITLLIAALSTTWLLTSCNDYLDVTPDNRTEIDTEDKVGLLLAGSYPDNTYAPMINPRIDNVTDKNTGTESGAQTNRDAFFWRDGETQTRQDSPAQVWVALWHSIAGANGALDAIELLGGADRSEKLSAYQGEALTLRAFCHFILACCYSPLYDLSEPAKNGTNLGLPYITEQETEINKQYERGNVEELWSSIQKDLEEGLKRIAPVSKGISTYHFNPNAAYAFATRFYLYKGDYAKVIEMANRVIPQPALDPETEAVALEDPATTFVKNNFQDWPGALQSMSSSTDIKIAFNSTSNPSILLLSDVASDIASRTNSWRYATSDPDLDRTVSAQNPTGATFAYKIFHSGDWNYYIPKFQSYFKTTTVNASTGVYHAAYPWLRMEEILINRAEAYALSGDTLRAVADLNLFCRTRIVNYNERSHSLTLAKITSFYRALINDPEFYMNKYNAMGAQSWTLKQKALVHFILLCRQNEFIHESLRYWDMIRYKMPCTHTTNPQAGGESNTLYPGDDRWVIQVPDNVVLAGMELNPRTNILSPQW